MLSDEGDKDTEIGERVGAGVATVERVRQKFVQHGLDEALTEARRLERKRKLDGKVEAFLVQLPVAMLLVDGQTGRCNC